MGNIYLGFLFKTTPNRITSGGSIHIKIIFQYSETILIARQEYLACPTNLMDTIKNMFIQLRIYQGQDLSESSLGKMVRLIIRMIIIRRS